MSTVLIIGASRGIGLETVKLALKAGHLRTDLEDDLDPGGETVL